jgi:hypothetical protein
MFSTKVTLRTVRNLPTGTQMTIKKCLRSPSSTCQSIHLDVVTPCHFQDLVLQAAQPDHSESRQLPHGDAPLLQRLGQRSQPELKGSGYDTFPSSCELKLFPAKVYLNCSEIQMNKNFAQPSTRSSSSVHF